MPATACFHTLDISRRGFLRNAALVAGAGLALTAATAPTAALAGAKFSQKMAKYQPTPKGPQDCANCGQFQPDTACKIVDGSVSPQGWCTLYSPKGR